MKNIAAGFLMMTMAGTISAQKIAAGKVFPGTFLTHMGKSIPDTLYNDFFVHEPVLYQAPVGGYMNGTNGYGDVEKAQETRVPQPYYLTGVVYWFALKNKTTGGDTSSVVFKLYKKDVSQLVNGVSRLVPGSLLETDTVKLADLNADTAFVNGLNFFSLSIPLLVNEPYVAAFSTELMNVSDTVALYGTSDGLVGNSGYSWEKWEGKWNTIRNAWELDVDFAIFPVRDIEGINISENDAFSRVSVFPVPAVDVLNVKGVSGQDRFVVLDIAGRVIRSGRVSEDSFSLDISSYTAGNYVLGLYAADKPQDAGFFRFVKK